MDAKGKKIRHGLGAAALVTFALLVATIQGASLSTSDFCDDGGLTGECVVNDRAELGDGETFNGNNLTVDATINSTGTFYLNFSGTTDFKTNSRLEGNGEIYSDEITGLNNLELDSGNPGNFYLCEREGDVSCSMKDDAGTSVNVSYGRNSKRAVFRTIEEDWSKGFLEWTEDVSLTSQIDAGFSSMTVDYTINNLVENKDFQILEDGSEIKSQNSGVQPRKVQRSEFSEGTSINLTTGNNLRLEPKPSQNLTIGGTTEADVGPDVPERFTEAALSSFESEKLVVQEVQLYSRKSQTIEYKLYKSGETSNILSGSYSHTGTGWERVDVSDVTLTDPGGDTNSYYYLAVSPQGYKYYGTGFGDYGTRNGVRWRENDDRYAATTSPRSMGLNGSNGFKPQGTYNSSIINAGEDVEWLDKIVSGNFPTNTSYDISFSTNESGTWKNYDNIESVPDSQYLGFNATLQTDKDFETPEITDLNIEYNPPGPDGSVNFSTTLSDVHNFEVIELDAPSSRNVQQENDLIGAPQSNNLSAVLEDQSSGISEALLATNETGTLENKTEYSKTFDYPESVTGYFDWKNNSIDTIKEINWEIWFKDASGNWNSTDTRTFTLDGKGPEYSNIDYNEFVDVDYGATPASAVIDDSLAPVDEVFMEENSTGIFSNYTLNKNSGIYSKTISRSEPAAIEFKLYSKDSLENWNSISRIINFQNISISQSLTDTKVNTSESFQVSGSLELLPENNAVSSETVEIWTNTDEWVKKDEVISDENGDFSSRISIEKSGTHEIKVNTTNENGISGENSKEVKVGLEITQQSSIFDRSDNSHADVDRTDRIVNLTADISNPVDTAVSKVEANVDIPDGGSKIFELTENTGRTWYKEVNTSEQFGDTQGEYNVVYSADTSSDSSTNIGSNFPESVFYVENISVNSSVGELNVSIGEETGISGNVLLEPYENTQDFGNVTIDVEDGPSYNFSPETGAYTGQISAGEPGNKTVNISYENQKGIKGFNTTYFYAYNLSARIEEALIEDSQGGGLQIYRDNDTDGDIQFKDNVTADSENPFANYEISLNYNYPEGWNPFSINSDIGTLKPGESAENSPDFNIGRFADLGPKQVNISTNTRQDIVSKDNITVEVWSKSQSKYNNLREGQSLNRANSFYNVTANVTDIYSNEKIEGINVTLYYQADEIHAYALSNSSGMVELPINLSDIGTGTDIRFSMGAQDEPNDYINSTENAASNLVQINILGKMQRGSEEDIRPVYRKNDATVITGEIEDSTGSPMINATTYLEIENEVFGPQETGSQYDTLDNGTYEYNYNPPESIEPGVYNATINSSKDQFDDFEFNRSVEVRGELTISNLVERDIVQRGKSFDAASSVVDEFGEEDYGNVSWRLNSTNIGNGEDTSLSVPKNLERGKYNLEAATHRKFMDDDADTTEVEVYGLASVKLSPKDFTIRPDNTVNLKAEVKDENTSEKIEDYPVEFKIDDTTYIRNTNSSGVATYEWSVSEGYHDISTSIDDNSSLRYNVTESTDSTEAFVGDKLYLDTFEFSEKDIYRYFKTPYRAVFNINLTRTSDTINRVPVANEEVSFTINGSKTISCTTDSTGACENALIYDPDSSVSAGNLTVNASTDRDGWIDLNTINNIDAESPVNNLIVRGQLITSLNSPADDSNLARGDTVDLSATTDTLVGGQVERNLTWKINENEIRTGYDETWDVPATQPTGKASLTATGNGEFFASDSDSIDVWILGNAESNLVAPENDSAIGYADPVQVRCEVTSQGATINDYPVEFVDNRSGTYEVFATKQTEDTGDSYQATASWNPPEEVTSVEAGCRIADNRTVGYTAETPLDTKVYETFDDINPDISNLSVPEGVNPGSNANITFNASDEQSLKATNVTVTGPFLNEDYPEVTDTSGTGYKAVYDTDGKANGDYTVEVKVTDSSGNNATDRQTFSIRPGGEISTNKNEIRASQITQDTGYSEAVEASLKVDEVANDTKIKLQLDDEGILDSNETSYNCGDLESGQYCNRSFEIIVPPTTVPTDGSPLYATVEGEWDNPEKTELTRVNDFTAVKVDKNPEIDEINGNATLPIPHGDSASRTFSVESYGNSPIKDYRTVFIEDSIERNWATINNGEQASIAPRDSIGTSVELSPPVGTPTGLYTGQVQFKTSNSKNISRNLSMDVPADFGYEVPSSITTSAVKGINDTLTTFQVNSTGNVNMDLEYAARNGENIKPCAQNIDPGIEFLQRQGKTTIEVKYDLRDVDFDQECSPNLEITPTDADANLDRQIPDENKKNITLNIDVLDFKVDPSQRFYDGMPGDNKSLTFDSNLGGSPVTEENIDYRVEVDGQETSIPDKKAFGNGTYDLNYTIPEVEDAQTHDVDVIVEQTSYDVERRSNAGTVSVPDITPPQFQFFDIEGVDPNSTQVIEVPVTDNSGKVENVSMTLEGPDNVSNYELSKISGEEKWEVSIPEIDAGVYTANFTAYDSSGYSKSVTDTFRVSGNTNFDGSFTTRDGRANSGAELVFKDSQTGEEVSETISSSGEYSLNLKEGNYDVEAEFDNQRVELKNTPVDENTSGFRAERLSSVETSGLTPSDRTKRRFLGIGVDTGLEPESALVELNYSGLDDDAFSDYTISELEIARCPNYDYESLTCDSSNFETYEIEPLDVNKARKTISIDVSGFSSYTLFAPSESSNESTEEEESDDGGGGGGSGGISQGEFSDLNDSVSETREGVRNLSEKFNDSDEEYVNFGSSSINAELRPGESKRVSLSVRNSANDSQTFIFDTSDVISQYVDGPGTVVLERGESRDVVLNISAPASDLPGSYSGSLSIESDEANRDIPVNLQILPPQDKLLDMSIDPVFGTVNPGSPLRIETTFSNQGYARNVDITMDIEVIDPDKNSTVARIEKTVAVGTTLTRVFEVDIPEDAELKRYSVRGSARYTNLDVQRVATAASSIQVDLPFWDREFFGFTYGNIGLGILLVLLISSVGFSIYYYRRKQALKKKRYMEDIDLSTIPTGGNKQAYLGKIAEVGTRTFLELDDLTTHALIAGATGSGKTVTGQDIVEEALENGANVIVLDPTAQWTGYLRENKDPNMTELYDDYGLSESDARSFDGNIRAVEPGDDIDITPYLEQDEDGQIIVFSLHKLDSKNIDEFANNTIQQVFDANLPERNGLETVIVYDEVHRLLEKFGGDGEGLKQLERGAREFRKWGVGMVLLSQVISDFSGEIRANIGTTIQMRTQYDDDLDRIKNKFGIDTVKSIAKAEVGSGMIQNSDYNHGRPYFVDFRPLLHSPHRLSDEKLEKYEKYNKRIDKIEDKIESLEEEGEDVYEYQSELKLAKRNLKKGSFSLVDTYIEELEEKLDI